MKMAGTGGMGKRLEDGTIVHGHYHLPIREIRKGNSKVAGSDRGLIAYTVHKAGYSGLPCIATHDSGDGCVTMQGSNPCVPAQRRKYEISF